MAPPACRRGAARSGPRPRRLVKTCRAARKSADRRSSAGMRHRRRIRSRPRRQRSPRRHCAACRAARSLCHPAPESPRRPRRRRHGHRRPSDIGDGHRRLTVLAEDMKAGRRKFGTRQRKPLHHRGARLLGQFKLPALLDALEHGADALFLEARHHGRQQREASTGLHQLHDPVGIEFDDIRPELLDAVDVGFFSAEIVDSDAKTVAPERLDEIVEGFLRCRFLLGHLAHDAVRIDVCFVQHQPHLAQRLVGDAAVGEHRRVEIDEDGRLPRQAGASVQEVQRPCQSFDMQAVGRRARVEKTHRRLRLAVAKRPDQPLEGCDRKLAGLEGEDGLEGALQRVDAPDTAGGAVIMADDMGKPDTARQGFLAPQDWRNWIAILPLKGLPAVDEFIVAEDLSPGSSDCACT
ncbi:hypothetical protein MESS4_820020 [Mesorhizobium sp. STM 4661]|nr:hypothetical protein MESS4_820020 [Mesorhizobium sp. STM 4661]